jgi:hypothetical protein
MPKWPACSSMGFSPPPAAKSDERPRTLPAAAGPSYELPSRGDYRRVRTYGTFAPPAEKKRMSRTVHSPHDFHPIGRFADRTKRLARRQESQIFRHYLMPIAWILSLAGFCGLVVLWIGEGRAGMADSAAFPVFAALFAGPGLTALLRIVRGHFHAAVREMV